jgi:hypothetical protein
MQSSTARRTTGSEFVQRAAVARLGRGVLDLLITHETNGIRFNELDRQRLKRMRYQGNDHAIPEEVNAAYTDHPPGT